MSDRVEPAGLDRGMDLLEVRKHHVLERSLREILGEDDLAEVPVVNRSDDEIEPVRFKKGLDVIGNASVEVDLCP